MVMTDRFPLARHSTLRSSFFLSLLSLSLPYLRVSTRTLVRPLLPLCIRAQLAPSFSYIQDETYFWYFDPMRNTIHGCDAHTQEFVGAAILFFLPNILLAVSRRCLKSNRKHRTSEVLIKKFLFKNFVQVTVYIIDLDAQLIIHKL